MFSLQMASAAELRQAKCLDCSKTFCLNSTSRVLKDTPNLLEYYKNLKNMESPGTGNFIDPNEKICDLCYAKFKKAARTGQFPRSFVSHMHHKTLTDYTEHQRVTYSSGQGQQVQVPQQQSSIPNPSQSASAASYPLWEEAVRPLGQREVQRLVCWGDGVVSVGNVGYAAKEAVLRHLPPSHLTHLGTYVPHPVFIPTPRPFLRFRSPFAPPTPFQPITDHHSHRFGQPR